MSVRSSLSWGQAYGGQLQVKTCMHMEAASYGCLPQMQTWYSQTAVLALCLLNHLVAFPGQLRRLAHSFAGKAVLEPVAQLRDVSLANKYDCIVCHCRRPGWLTKSTGLNGVTLEPSSGVASSNTQPTGSKHNFHSPQEQCWLSNSLVERRCAFVGRSDAGGSQQPK